MRSHLESRPIPNWRWWFGVDLKPRGPDELSLRDHMEFGKQSEIPLCCRLWFVSIWDRVLYKIHAFWALYASCVPEQAEYIPCPLCLLRDNIVRVKTCDYTRRSE